LKRKLNKEKIKTKHLEEKNGLLEHHNQMIDTNNNQLNRSKMLLLEKISNMDEHIERASVYARRICLNTRQVGRDLHRYQQSIAEIGAFLIDIGNIGFASPLQMMMNECKSCH
jgi:hypothetical protein